MLIAPPAELILYYVSWLEELLSIISHRSVLAVVRLGVRQRLVVLQLIIKIYYDLLVVGAAVSGSPWVG